MERRPLSRKQAELMELVCLGKTMVEASTILRISVTAAKSRLEEARKRLDAHKDTLAVARYLEEKYKSPY